MKIENLVVGQLAANCYLVWNKTGQALIIDPGDSGDYITEKILSLELKPKMIIATHGHFDHVSGGALDGCVYSCPFGKLADVEILLVDLRDIAAAIEQGGHIPVVASELLGSFYVLPYT